MKKPSTDYYVIAGAASDLGHGLAWRLSALGYPLLLIDHQSAVLEQLSDALVDAGYTQPLLAIIDPMHPNFEQQCQQLQQASISLSGFCWTGAWLDNPTPVMNMTLMHWQQGLLLNVTYPLMLLKSCLPHCSTAATLWIAQPQPTAFTQYLSAASSLWLQWLPILNQELGTLNKIQLWQLPRLADRMHRLLYPLLEVDAFTPIDTAIDAWLLQWQTDY